MPASDNRRNRELAQIHIAQAQLGLDDDVYRDMLFTIARVRSAADLDYAGRKAVLAHLRSRGFRAFPHPRPSPGGRGRYPGRPANMDHPDRGPSLRKIEALLAEAGRPWSYAHALARRMFHVERIEWCETDQLHSIVAALMIDQRRRAKKDTADAHET